MPWGRLTLRSLISKSESLEDMPKSLRSDIPWTPLDITRLWSVIAITCSSALPFSHALHARLLLVPAHQVQQAMRQAEIETIIGVKDVVRLSIVHIVKGEGLGYLHGTHPLQ